MFHEKDLIGVLLLCLSSCMLLGCGNSQETVSVEFHGYSFEIPADWEDSSDNTERTLYYYPTNGIVMIDYSEGISVIEYDMERDAIIEGVIEDVMTNWGSSKIGDEIEITVAGAPAYQYPVELSFRDMSFTLNAFCTLFEHQNHEGFFFLTMASLEDAEEDYTEEFNAILASIQPID